MSKDYKIEYVKDFSLKGYDQTVRDDISHWIRANLREGDIDSQMKNMAKLLSLIAETWLIANPSRVHEVAEAIGCEYRNHIITGATNDTDV